MRTLKKALCLVLCLVMVLGLCVFSVGAVDNFAGYTDANQLDENYAEAVDVLIGLGVVEGMDATTLNLNGNYTRAQAAKITAYVALGPTAAANLKCSEAPFTDVGVDHWAAGYIAYCADHGILDGMGDGTFAPEATLTGYQFGKMMLCVVGYGQQGEYKDVGWEINVAKDGVRRNVYDNVLSAATNNVITRQQAMQMAFNTLTNVGVVKYSGLINDYVNAQASTNDVITGRSVDANFLIKDNYPNCYKAAGRVDYTTEYVIRNSSNSSSDTYVVPVNADYMDYGKNAHVWYKKTTKGPVALTNYYVDDVEIANSNGETSFADLTNNKKSGFKAEVDNDYVGVINAADYYDYPRVTTSGVYDVSDDVSFVRGTSITFYDNMRNDGWTDEDGGWHSYNYHANGKADTVTVLQKSVAVLNAAPSYSKDGTKVTLNAMYPNNSKSSVWTGSWKVSDFTGLDGLAAGDVVLFFKDAAGVTHLEKAQSKVDKLVRYTGTAYDDKNVYLHSATSTYRISLLPTVTDNTGKAMTETVIHTLIGVDANFYFDDFGNIVWWSEVQQEAGEYAVLLDYGFTRGSAGNYAVSGKDSIKYDLYAKLLKTNGDQVKVVVKNVTTVDGDAKTSYEGIYVIDDDVNGIIHWAKGEDENDSMNTNTDAADKLFPVGTFYTYTVDSNGAYSLREVGNQVNGTGVVENGKSAITGGFETVYGNYDTVYLFKDPDNNYGRTVSVRNAPKTPDGGTSTIAAVYDKNRTAVYVYAVNAVGEKASNTYFFLGLVGVQVDDKNTANVNEKAYVYRAVKNGELVDVSLATDTTDIDGAPEYQGFCDVKLTTDSKRPEGYAASITPVAEGGAQSAASTLSVRYDKHGYVRSGSDAYTFTDDVKVYVLDKNSKGEWTLEAGGTEIITEDVNDLVWVNLYSANTPLHVKEFYIIRMGNPAFDWVWDADDNGYCVVADNQVAKDIIADTTNFEVSYRWVGTDKTVHEGTDANTGIEYGAVVTVTITHLGSNSQWINNIAVKF